MAIYGCFFLPLSSLQICCTSNFKGHVSISEEDQKALIAGKVTRQWIIEKYPGRERTTSVAAAERYKEWVKKVMQEYGYKTKKALMQNMQHVSVEQDSEHIIFIPSNHESIE